MTDFEKCVKLNSQVVGTKAKLKKKSKRVPLVITFHPLFQDFGNKIHQNLHLLYIDQEA